MSSQSWPDSLSRALERLRKPDRPPCVAVVGVGHELRGDDAAGVAVARALRELVAPGSRLLAIDAGPAPENYTGTLRRFGPDLVLLIDAAQMGDAPGAVRWLTWQAIGGISASTHTLPLHVLAGFLAADIGCEVALIGIQPGGTALGTSLSPAVRRAVDLVVRELARYC